MAEDLTPKRQVSSIRRLLVGYLLVMGLLGGGFAVGTVLLVRAADRDRAIALIETDAAETLDKLDGDAAMRRERALAIVLARSAIRDDRIYRLSEGGRVIAGASAAIVFQREGQRNGLYLEADSPSALAKIVPLGGGSELLIGRTLAQGALTQRLLVIGGFVLAAAMALAGIVGFLATRELRRRIGAINDACDRVKTGDFAARAPSGGAPDEFATLAGHVNAMLERIDTLVGGLRDVSNRIAHDLRTPVARLKTSIEQAASAKALPEARALAGAAAAETDEILQTFEALLDIAEVEAGSTGGLAPIRLDQAIGSALDLYDSVAEAAGVRLRSTLEPVTILGEKMLVIRLAANLIDNAIKFSPEGGIVEVGVIRDGRTAALSVRDEGPGIPSDERDRVLGRFQRGAAVRHIAGHGLGLALVTAVAKRHGARIDLSEAAPGLAISVRFEAFDGVGAKA